VETKRLSWIDVEKRSLSLALKIIESLPNETIKIYGIPRGGIPVAINVVNILLQKGRNAKLVVHPKEASFWVDDIIATGNTWLRYQREYGLSTKCFALVSQEEANLGNCWWVFPWEQMTKEFVI